MFPPHKQIETDPPRHPQECRGGFRIGIGAKRKPRAGSVDAAEREVVPHQVQQQPVRGALGGAADGEAEHGPVR